jgi:hypothetical protein
MLSIRPWSAKAGIGSHVATCAITAYTLSGSFNRLGGVANFTVHADGGCVGTATGVTVNLGFTSLGSWSCDAGAAFGSGTITPTGGFSQDVDASLVNAGGEYIIEVHSFGAAAAGQFTTLPVQCDLGTTQTTIGGTGTLTFTA